MPFHASVLGEGGCQDSCAWDFSSSFPGLSAMLLEDRVLWPGSGMSPSRFFKHLHVR